MQPGRSRKSVWKENLQQALDIVRAHRMRSALLILGVAIGISSILMIVTVLAGLSRKVYHDMVSANRPYVYVQKFDWMVSGEDAEELMRRRDLTPEDASALSAMCPSLDKVSFFAESQMGGYVVRYGAEKTPPTGVLGCDHTLPHLFTIAVDRGRFFTETEVNHRERVIVLGYGPANALFESVDPIGRYVDLGGAKYEVVGTFASRKHFTGKWSDNFVAVPHTTYRKDLQKEGDWLTIGATMREGRTLEQGVEEATHALRVRRGLRPGQQNDFSVTTSEAFLDLVRRVTVPIGIVLTIIASIGLVVGGIGVMNIMLISVAERTREIGVRRAIGAEKSDILQQFLIESATLTGMGGAIGTVLGTVLAFAIARLIHFPFYFSVPWTVTAVLFSLFVGLVFGLYPARRASEMDPVAALRYE